MNTNLVRIQKAGEPSQHASCRPESSGPVRKASERAADPAVAPEPKVEIRELESGIFEITVTCRCGEKSVVRCESLMAS